MRLWIDENLTPRLAAAAHARGYQATTSRDRGRLRLPDAKLYHEVRDGDWILVTNDRQDFERLLAQADLHPGLIVLPLRKRDEQTAILEKVIDYIEATAAAAGETGTNWMINRVVEIDPETEECSTHLLPRPDP